MNFLSAVLKFYKYYLQLDLKYSKPFPNLQEFRVEIGKTTNLLFAIEKQHQQDLIFVLTIFFHLNSPFKFAPFLLFSVFRW